MDDLCSSYSENPKGNHFLPTELLDELVFSIQYCHIFHEPYQNLLHSQGHLLPKMCLNSYLQFQFSNRDGEINLKLLILL